MWGTEVNTYGQKLQPGDRWKVGRRWVVLRDDYTVLARCGGVYSIDRFVNHAAYGAYSCYCDDITHTNASCGLRGYATLIESYCIAQQMVAEGLI